MTRWWHRPLAASGAVASMVGCSQPAPSAQRARVPETAPSAPSAGDAASAGAGDDVPSLPAPATTTTEAPTTTLVVTTTAPLELAPAVVLAVPLPEDEPAETDEEYWRNQPGYVETGREALLACIRSYESGGDYTAVSPSGQYLGAYQFDLPTWRSVGGSGNPAHASAAEQDERAWALYQSRGLQPWPTPARRCG